MVRSCAPRPYPRRAVVTQGFCVFIFHAQLTVNERRRAYGEKQIGRAYTMSDVTIYQEDTIIGLLNEKNIGLADSTAKRARKPRTDDDDTGLGIAGLLDMEDGEIAADEDEPPRLPDDHGGSAAGDAAANEDNAVLMDLVKNALKQIAALEKRVRIIECSSEGTVQIKTHDDIITMYCFYQKDDNEDFLQRCKRLLRTFDLDDVADSLMSAERLKTGDGKLYASAMSELKFRSPEMATKLIENKGQFAVSTQNDEQKRDLLERLKKLRPRGGRDIDFAFKTERVFSKKTKPETKPAPAGLELF